MNQNDIERGIQALKGRRLPSCPGNLEANVLRRVRLSQDEEVVDIFSWVAGLVPKTEFVATAMAMVVVTSSMVTFASAKMNAYDDFREAELSRAFGFDIMEPVELVAIGPNR